MEVLQNWFMPMPRREASPPPLVVIDPLSSSFEEDVTKQPLGMPWEIIHHIVSFLNSKDLCVLSLVAYEWFSVCGDDVHWKRLFEMEKATWLAFVNPRKIRMSSWQKISKLTQNMTSNLTDLTSNITSHVTVLINNTLNDINNSTSDSPTPPRAHNTNSNATSSARHIRHAMRDQKWKSRYINERIENAHSYKRDDILSYHHVLTKPPPVVMPWKFQFQVPFTKKTHRVPMLGSGMDSSAKDLLYAMMWEKNVGLPVTGLHPGVEGLGSGVGFDINGVNLNIAALHKFDFTKAPMQWQSYFQDVDGIILVVNGDDPDFEKNSTVRVISDLVPANTPFLVLLCHHVALASPECPPMRAVELASHLELEKTLKNRWWCVRDVEMQTLEGIGEGLQWLASLV